ncbi:MAG: DUF1559 domain-containing protein [Verrucomicrobia bacterium]|nr:DUF1559 domain-containing protein [Verrucomicrobiota bacterium]
MKQSVSQSFTLVELLVVIAIISILAALLTPAFGRAKSAAKGAACLNNLKQIGVGMMLYGTDYDGYPPGAAYPWGADYIHEADDADAAAATGGAVGLGLLHKFGFLRGPGVFYCPGRRPGDRLTATAPSYGWQAFGLGGWVETSYFVATANIYNSSLDFRPWHRFGTTDPTKPLAFDFCAKNTPPGESVDVPYGTSRHRHGRGYNFVFFDGSARFVADPANYLENNYTFNNGVQPWVYNNNNMIYYIHTQWFGWRDHTQR